MLTAIGGEMISFRRSRTQSFAPANTAKRFSVTDARVLAGLALVVLSMVVGALLLRHDDVRTTGWQATRDLSAGASVTEADFTPTLVDLAGASAQYAVEPSVGQLARDLKAGELLPLGAIGAAATADQRLVTLPVEPLHAPELANGDVVDVWTTADETGASRLVLAGVHVVSVTTDVVGAGGESGVVVAVVSQDAGKLVEAVRAGVIDVVKAPVT